MTLRGPFWLKWVTILCGPQAGQHMEPVVTLEEAGGELYEFLFLLLLSWVAAGSVCFVLGWCCAGRTHSHPSQGERVPARWQHLVQRALAFVGRRRRIALAFGNLRRSSLRNGPTSRPNAARRAHRARNHTPGPRVLNEGPAIPRTDGPNRRRAGPNQ